MGRRDLGCKGLAKKNAFTFTLESVAIPASRPLPFGCSYGWGTASGRSRHPYLYIEERERHPTIQILPPCGMMSLKDLKEHHYTKQGGTLCINQGIRDVSPCDTPSG